MKVVPAEAVPEKEEEENGGWWKVAVTANEEEEEEKEEEERWRRFNKEMRDMVVKEGAGAVGNGGGKERCGS